MDEKKPYYPNIAAYPNVPKEHRSYEDFLNDSVPRYTTAPKPVEPPSRSVRSEAEELSERMELALLQATSNPAVRRVVEDITLKMIFATLVSGQLGKSLLISAMEDGARRISELVDKASVAE